MGFGKSVATRRLAAQHGVFAFRILAKAKRAQGQFQICNQAENSVLFVLDPVLRSRAPLEFPNGALERRRHFR